MSPHSPTHCDSAHLKHLKPFWPGGRCFASQAFLSDRGAHFYKALVLRNCPFNGPDPRMMKIKPMVAALHLKEKKKHPPGGAVSPEQQAGILIKCDLPFPAPPRWWLFTPLPQVFFDSHLPLPDPSLLWSNDTSNDRTRSSLCLYYIHSPLQKGWRILQRAGVRAPTSLCNQ